MTDNLNDTDKQLLESCNTGEGLVPVTPQLISEMQKSMKARDEYMAEHWPQLIKDCPDETRLAITAQVFRAIIEHAEGGGTFRYLIYDRLGFGPEAYYPLYLAGGMTISNEFDLSAFKETGDMNYEIEHNELLFEADVILIHDDWKQHVATFYVDDAKHNAAVFIAGKHKEEAARNVVNNFEVMP